MTTTYNDLHIRADLDPKTKKATTLSVSVVLGTAAVLLVGLRLWVDIRVLRKADVSGFFILIATVLTLASLILGCLVATIFEPTTRSVGTVNADYLKLFYASEQLYLYGSGFIRISILLYYRRFSHCGVTRWFDRTVVGMIMFIVLALIGSSIGVFFTCTPVDAFWNFIVPSWTSTHTYHCQNRGIMIISVSAFNLLEDVVVALLPLPLFWKMQLPRRQIIGLWALFGLGMVVCTGGAVRIAYSVTVVYNADKFVVASYVLWLWTSVEMTLGLICSSAPALKVVCKHFFQGDDGKQNTAASTEQRSLQNDTVSSCHTGEMPGLHRGSTKTVTKEWWDGEDDLDEKDEPEPPSASTLAVTPAWRESDVQMDLIYLTTPAAVSDAKPSATCMQEHAPAARRDE